jgi:hypothetical protein
MPRNAFNEIHLLTLSSPPTITTINTRPSGFMIVPFYVNSPTVACKKASRSWLPFLPRRPKSALKHPLENGRMVCLTVSSMGSFTPISGVPSVVPDLPWHKS